MCKMQHQLVAQYFYLLIRAPKCFGLDIFRELSLTCAAYVVTSGVPGGGFGAQPPPPEIPKALQNRAKQPNCEKC